MAHNGGWHDDAERVALAYAQGGYYLATGLWPLVGLGSFQRVTGPKADTWLVKTAGVLIAAVGATLVSAARARRVTPEMPLLAAGCAAGLTAIDVVYVARRRIAPVYLLDALAEVLLLAGWGIAWRRSRR
jgi:hypothetical protein